MSYIETRTGKKFYFESDDTESIDIWDIAWAIANECRFGGHCNRFYSVAEHSCYVYDAVVALTTGCQTRLFALLHDAHEAYTKDLMRPLRQAPQLSGYQELAARTQDRVIRKYGLKFPPTDIYLIDMVDVALLRAEAKLLMPSKGADWEWPDGLPEVELDEFCGWTPQRARGEFHGRFVSEYGSP